MSETTKEGRDLQRRHIGNKGRGGIYGEEAMRFINDADRCAELEAAIDRVVNGKGYGLDYLRTFIAKKEGVTR